MLSTPVDREVNSGTTPEPPLRAYPERVHAPVARRLGDLAIAVVLAGVGVAEIWVPLGSVMGEGSRALSTAVVVVVCAALVFRRTHPLPAALVALLAWPVVYSVSPVLVLFWGQFVPIVVALYSVARHGNRRQAFIGGGVGAGVLLFFDLRVPELGEPGEIVFHWLVCTVAWALGQFVRGYEGRARAQAERAVAAERSSREQALQAVADERARIARELHDIVAHSVSVMVVQAGAAQKALDDPAFVGTALESIRTTGTTALDEMRRVVALIRDPDAPAALRPQPDLADLERLVAEMDVPTRLRVEGDPRPLSAGVALAAFRIVQEALTNVRRHADAGSVEVVLRHLPEHLEVEVVDDGRGADAPSGGHGLIGMRERAQMYGGSLFTDSRPGGGFTVRAVLPLSPATAPEESPA